MPLLYTPLAERLGLPRYLSVPSKFLDKSAVAALPRAISIVVVLGAATAAMGVTPYVDAGELDVTGEVEVSSVDNANRVGVPEDEIDETQRIARLNAVGEYQPANMSLLIDYELEDRRYSEQKLRDQQLILGHAVLEAFTADRMFKGILSHSSQELLINDFLGDSPDNLDTRTVVNAGLTAGFGHRLTRLELSVSQAEIRYDVSETLEASRQAFGVQLAHRPDPLYTMGVGFDAYTLDYKQEPLIVSNDVDYQRVSLFLLSELRRLSYSVRLGWNEVQNNASQNNVPQNSASQNTPPAGGESERAPFANIEVNWKQAGSEFSFSHERYITDTTQGTTETSQLGATADGLDSGVATDGRLTQADQYRYRGTAISWLNRQMCRGCIFSVNLGEDTEDYVNVTSLNSRDRYVQVTWNYQPSRHYRLTLGANRRDTAFDQQDNDFTSDLLRAKLDWLTLLKNGQLSAFWNSSKRKAKSPEGLDFDDSAVGLSLQYDLY